MNANMNKLALVIGAMAMASGAWATDSGTNTMGVTASIQPECAVGTVAVLTFGALTTLTAAGAPNSAQSLKTGGGTFNVVCTTGTLAPMLKFTSPNAAASAFRLVGADAISYIVYSLTDGVTSITQNQAAAFSGLAADGATKSLALTATIDAVDRNG